MKTTDCLFVRSGELRKLLGISEATLFRWVRSGTLPPPRRIRNRLFWPRQVIEAFLAEQQASQG